MNEDIEINNFKDIQINYYFGIKILIEKTFACKIFSNIFIHSDFSYILKFLI